MLSNEKPTIYWLIEIEFLVTFSNELEVAPLKNLFFLSVLKLDVKDSFGYNNENERMRKIFP